MSYGAYRSYLEFGLVSTAIPIALLVCGVAAVVYHQRKLQRGDSEVWDWWEEEIKE